MKTKFFACDNCVVNFLAEIDSNSAKASEENGGRDFYSVCRFPYGQAFSEVVKWLTDALWVPLGSTKLSWIRKGSLKFRQLHSTITGSLTQVPLPPPANVDVISCQFERTYLGIGFALFVEFTWKFEHSSKRFTLCFISLPPPLQLVDGQEFVGM